MQILIAILFFIYGLIFGSFFNVVGLRVPNGTLFTQQRSYCDTCQRTLSWKELIPVWSFAIQKGKCRTCSETISPLYPIMEFTTGLLFAFTYLQFGWNPKTILGLLLISLVIPVTVADIAYRRIPNKILIFFVPLFVVYQLIFSPITIQSALLGAGTAFFLLLFILILSKGGMGAGDLKYLTLLGFVFGLKGFLLLFFLSTVYGTIGGLVTMKVKKGNKKLMIPFGPYIGLATLTALYYGKTMITWYLALIGF
ncbi:prepilin peptidase [Jeotgalibaca sp. A127]|uniref:prepilin peptidase n=1 Tax=Jeotgalibaca sp. A127 TaxID=3457324 RepID=UPI003FCF952F